MNTKKIYSEILKRHCAGKEIKGCVTNESIYYFPENHIMYVINKAIGKWPFRDDVITENVSIDKINLMYGEAVNYEEGFVTTDRKALGNGREIDTVVKIKSRHCHAWINVKTLSNFNDPIFHIRNGVSPILVYESDKFGKRMVGMIAPVRMFEDYI